MPSMHYAGIGSRRTPDSILELIAHPHNNAARFLASCANPSTTRSALLTDRKELLRVVGPSLDERSAMGS